MVKKDSFYSKYNRDRIVKAMKSSFIITTYECMTGYKYNDVKLYCYKAVSK